MDTLRGLLFLIGAAGVGVGLWWVNPAVALIVIDPVPEWVTADPLSIRTP